MAGAAEPSQTHSLELGHGFALICGVVGKLDGSLEVAVAFRGRTIFRRSVAHDDPPQGPAFKLGPVRFAAQLDLDAFRGELSWVSYLSVRLPGRWRDLYRIDDRLPFSPGIGEVGSGPQPQEVCEPVVSHPKFGESQLCTPMVLRIFVDDEERAIAEVGRIVKNRMFPDHSGFVFNTVACVGKVPDGASGLYTDPTSHR